MSMFHKNAEPKSLVFENLVLVVTSTPPYAHEVHTHAPCPYKQPARAFSFDIVLFSSSHAAFQLPFHDLDTSFQPTAASSPTRARGPGNTSARPQYQV